MIVLGNNMIVSKKKKKMSKAVNDDPGSVQPHSRGEASSLMRLFIKDALGCQLAGAVSGLTIDIYGSRDLNS